MRNRTILTAGLILAFSISFSFGSPLLEDKPELDLSPEVEKLISTNTEQVVLIFGKFCIGCPIGDYVYTIKEKEGIVYVVMPDWTDIDIENVKRALKIKGEFVRAAEDDLSYARRLAEHLDEENWEHNYILLLKNGKIEDIKLK